MENFLAQLAATSFLEGVAVALAVAYVWLAARQNIWCWPCALVSTGDLYMAFLERVFTFSYRTQFLLLNYGCLWLDKVAR